MEYYNKVVDLFVVSQSAANSVQPSSFPKGKKMASDSETKNADSTQFGSVLETMDRFLETNESNLIVASLVSLEAKTNISRQYLARGALGIILGYFLFSNSVLDLVTYLLMFLYPSYRSYLLLQNKDDLTKEDLVDILKYWIFIGLFTTFDLMIGFLIPFRSALKLIFIVQCVLPRKSPLVDFAISHFVAPIFKYLEQNENIQQVNAFLGTVPAALRPHQD